MKNNTVFLFVFVKEQIITTVTNYSKSVYATVCSNVDKKKSNQGESVIRRVVKTQKKLSRGHLNPTFPVKIHVNMCFY